MSADVAIYTDASIYRGAGTWAVVVVRPGHDIAEHAGRLRGRFRSSTAVEGAAMANALWFARKRGLVERGDAVTIRSDNQPFVDRICGVVSKRSRKPVDPDIIRAAAYVVDTAATLGLELRAAWVKGHQPITSLDPHAFYNRRCDLLCRAARKGHKPMTYRQFSEHIAAEQRRLAKAAAACR